MLTRLNLIDFRCFEKLQLTLPEQGALFLGDNAQGKTTLLEAICVLLRLQSPRTSRNAHLIRHGRKSFGIAGVLDGVRRQIIWENKGPEYKVQGQNRTDQKHYLADSGLIVWMGNDDMSLVRGPADVRRRYMDFLGLQWKPGYRVALNKYKRALKARNILLKNPRHDLGQIAAYTELLVEYGNELVALRNQLLTRLVPHAEEAHRNIARTAEVINLKYKPSSKLPLEEIWEQSLARDLLLGQTQYGPHRDDMSLLLNNHPAAQFTSEGQQRTIALSLKLSQHHLLAKESGRIPLLLIDDIFGELDPGRRSALLDSLPLGTQTFITTTHPSWMKDTPLRIPAYILSEGKLTPLEK